MKKDDMAIFKATYISECKELTNEMETLLLELDQDAADNDTLNAIFRCAHSIKGGAGVFGFSRMGEFTHTLEAVLDNLRTGKLSISQELTDLLLEGSDILKQMITTIEEGKTVGEDAGDKVQKELANISNLPAQTTTKVKTAEVTKSTSSDIQSYYNISFIPNKNIFSTGNEPLLILKELDALGKMTVSTDLTALPDLNQLDPCSCYCSFVIDIETDKPITSLKEAFEFVEDDCKLNITASAGLFDTSTEPVKIQQEVPTESVKAPETANADSPEKEAAKPGAAIQTVNSIRVDVEKIDRLVNLVGELVITQAMIFAQTKGLPFDQFSSLLKGVEELNHHTRELQEAVMAVRMQPVKTLFSRMPRLVRDLSKRLNKNINLELSGETTEVDKTIIEQLSDPLMHIIRNSIDHGIETPEARIKAGKPAEGTIKLSADQRSGKIVLEIKDDGGGIRRDKVGSKAVEKKLITSEQLSVMTPEEIDALVFAPGFSTADVVSDVSGRGVGMDVVKRNIENIGGFIEMINNPGIGLELLIYIPLTLAILDGMIVGVGKENYIIPISNILETMRPKPEDIKKIADSNDLLNIRGEFIQILHLGKLFNVNGYGEDPSKALIVIVETNNSKFGLMVDELIGQQQVVIKSLDENSGSIEGVSGATILGDGKVSLILDITKLLVVAVNNNAKKRAA